MTFRYRYRKQIVVAILFLVTVSGIGVYIYLNTDFQKKDKKKEENILDVKKKVVTKVTKEKDNAKKSIMVDVKGEVVTPGIYTLESDKRVIDAINMAGGTTKNADTSVLNLSKKLEDEMVIIVYSNYEVRNFKNTKEYEKANQAGCREGVNGLENDACIENSTNTTKDVLSSKVSINTATLEELLKINGIGDAKAKAIISYREEKGPFEKIEDIKNVSGIGESIFEKIKDQITT